MNGQKYSWPIDKLTECPQYRVTGSADGIDELYYENETYRGVKTEVFAYLGIPNSDKPLPCVVCVHGGNGQAYRQWVEQWNARGYAAIAMDLNGKDKEVQPIVNGGPELKHENIFDLGIGWQNLWMYHSVAAVMRAHSLVRSLSSIDKNKVGIMGVSWGGYLTCITAGLDHRFACAISIYGCGFLDHNSASDWMKIFNAMNETERRRWHELCDPSRFLPQCRMPFLFVTGTNDYAFPLDSLKLSCSLIQSPVNLCVIKDMPHGQWSACEPKEIERFAGSLFGGQIELPTIGKISRLDALTVTALVNSKLPLLKSCIFYTYDSGTWQNKTWHQQEAIIEGSKVIAKLPRQTRAYFLAVEDSAGAQVSSIHEECV